MTPHDPGESGGPPDPAEPVLYGEPLGKVVRALLAQVVVHAQAVDLASLPDEVLDQILVDLPAARSELWRWLDPAVGRTHHPDTVVRLGELAAAVALEIEERHGVPAEWLLSRIAEDHPAGDGS